MALREDVAAKLVAMSLAVGVKTDIFLGTTAAMPALPKDSGPYVVIVDTGGTSPRRTHQTKYPRPSVQISVVADQASIARNKAFAIHEALDGLYNVILGVTFYLDVLATQEVTDLSADAVGRAKFGFNLTGTSR